MKEQPHLQVGSLLYYVPHRARDLVKKGSTYYNHLENVVLGRLKEQCDVGYYHGDDELQYKANLSDIHGVKTTAVFSPDHPVLFPLQTKTVLEKVKDGEVDWKTIKNREIVLLTFQDCKLQINEKTPSGDKLVSFELLSSGSIVTRTVRMYASSQRPEILIADKPLRPVFANLVGIRQHMHLQKRKDGSLIDMASNLKMIVKIPASGWSCIAGSCAITSFYLTERAMCCAWFLEDYEEYLTSLPSEQEHTEPPVQ